MSVYKCINVIPVDHHNNVVEEITRNTNLQACFDIDLAVCMA